MDKTDSHGPPSDRGSGQPLIEAARIQAAAARLRKESLMASGKLGAPPDFTSPAPSEALPNYRLLRELHRGGQGIVHLAVQQSTGRQVAVKIFRPDTAHHPSELGRFEREVDVLTRLRHPNIVTIHDCGRAGESLYLVMDYIEGCPLDVYLAQGRLSLTDTLLLFAKICDALHAAHLRGVIHRDVKPSNIRVDREGEPRILDFGLAKWAAAGSGATVAEAMTITGQFIGSLPWASPEQAQGLSETLDLRSDVYSLGVVFYQLLTGEFPYPVGGRMDDVIRHIATTSPVRPSTIDSAIGHELETILLKCLAKEPERRYQTAGELAADLRRYLAGEAIEAKRDSISYYLRKQLRRHKAAVAAVLAFALLLAAGFSISAAQWYRAEQALAREEAQRQFADQRARETQKVADFQARMLSQIDADAMGQDIKKQFREQVRSALNRQRLIDAPQGAEAAPGEFELEIAAFDKLAGPAPAVDLARHVLDEHLLKPAARSLQVEFAHQPLVAAQIGLAIGKAYHALGLYAQAEPYVRQSLDTHRKLLGNQEPRTIDSIGSLGLVMQHLGKLSEAETLLREALDARRRILGDDHPDTLHSLNNVGVLLYLTGEPRGSVTVLRQALDGRRRVLGKDHRDTLNSLLNLTNSLRGAGRQPQAEACGREAVEIARRTLDTKDTYMATALANLSGVLHDLGEYAEAESLLREALALRRDLLGDQNAEVATTLSNLGSILYDAGNLGQAEALYREALSLRRRLFGREHIMVAQSLSNLGLLLTDKKAYAEAEACLREALDLFRALVSAEHPAIAQTFKRLGWMLHQKGDDALAEPLLREAVELRRKVLGDRHPHLGASLHDLGWLLADQHRCAEAEPLLREAVSIAQGRYPPGHGNMEEPRMKLAECLILDAKFAEAETLLQQSSAALKASSNPESGVREYLIQTYVKLYEAWEAAEPAQGHDLKAAEWRAQLTEPASSPSPPSSAGTR
jgi:tetratricopeptide (TPR) repeat protein